MACLRNIYIAWERLIALFASIVRMRFMTPSTPFFAVNSEKGYVKWQNTCWGHWLQKPSSLRCWFLRTTWLLFRPLFIVFYCPKRPTAARLVCVCAILIHFLMSWFDHVYMLVMGLRFWWGVSLTLPRNTRTLGGIMLS